MPQILYFSAPQETDVQSSTKSLAELYARKTALSMTSSIVRTVTSLLIKARDAVETAVGDVFNSAPIVTSLMPHVLASISSLAVNDPASAVEVLTLIQDILPSVAALNNLNDDDSGCGGSEEEEEDDVTEGEDGEETCKRLGGGKGALADLEEEDGKANGWGR